MDLRYDVVVWIDLDRDGMGRDGRPKGRSSNPARVKNCLFSILSRLALCSTQPPMQWVPGTLSKGVKKLGREADYSPTNAYVKKTWIYTFTPHTSSRRRD
jgi:hypothetical protein